MFLVYWCDSLLGVHYCYYTSSARCLVFLNWVELLYGIYYSKDQGGVSAGIEPEPAVQQADALTIEPRRTLLCHLAFGRPGGTLYPLKQLPSLEE